MSLKRELEQEGCGAEEVQYDEWHNGSEWQEVSDTGEKQERVQALKRTQRRRKRKRTKLQDQMVKSIKESCSQASLRVSRDIH